jgi:hypothetical protein
MTGLGARGEDSIPPLDVPPPGRSFRRLHREDRQVMTPIDPFVGRRMRPTLLMRVLLWLAGRPDRQQASTPARLPRGERLGNHLRRDIGLPPIHDWQRWG